MIQLFKNEIVELRRNPVALELLIYYHHYNSSSDESAGNFGMVKWRGERIKELQAEIDRLNNED